MKLVKIGQFLIKFTVSISFVIYSASDPRQFMRIIDIFTKIKFLLFFLSIIFIAACSQLEIEPNRTTHEDFVTDDMKEGAANWQFKDKEGSSTLTELIFGGTELEKTRDDITFNVVLDKLSFMPLASVDSSSGVVITDWYALEGGDSRIKINVRIIDANLTNESIQIQMFKQEYDGNKWIDRGLDKENALKIKNSILTEARSLKTAIDLS